MKKFIFVISALTLMLSCIAPQGVPRAVQTDVSVYTQIPMAPTVQLTVETPIALAPGPNYVWIDGYWSWDYRYREYVWISGYWALSPYVGAYWIPGYWETYKSGYRWVDACWLPNDYHISYGYYKNRYDYYGRPVYYHAPHVDVHAGYVYSYDHRQDYRGKGYSSSSYFNNEPKDERSRVTKEYQYGTNTSTRTPATNRNTQGTIKIRNESVQRTPSGTTTTPQRQSNPATTGNTTRQTQTQTPPDNKPKATETNSRNESSSSSNSRQSTTTTTSPATRNQSTPATQPAGNSRSTSKESSSTSTGSSSRSTSTSGQTTTGRK
ncbi:MAG: YXWGXW repeat-containing protein [Prevotellaceae bacterium]|jgi:hypothetical protein|nr:YXWGXW repeat-containing protein [Prevotellaceae bacterium]